MNRLLLFLFLVGVVAFAQNTARLDGTVTDPQGAAVPGAQVEVLNVDTGAVLRTASGERGEWALLSMPAATYRVSVTATGFKKATIDGVLMNAGVPKTVNTQLEIGATTETVIVTGGAELVQTTSATVQSSVQQRQVLDLPFNSRGGMDLLVTQPGVQTGTTARNSYINGLPFAAINVTIDGINSQDNYYKNGDGFFTLIPARQDSLEEITLSTSASGADANAQGAATVKFVTKSGSNEFHGGAFWQHRNTALNANSYFNNINGLPRAKVILNQAGFHVGGPIWKNKLVFFTNYEIYRYPAQTSVTRTVMSPNDFTGNYTYPTAGGPVTVNVLQMAAAKGFTSTADPIIAQTLSQIDGYTKNGVLQPRVASNSDYNRNNLLFQPKGLTQYWTDTTRLDYNITDSHTLSLTWTYYKNVSSPDITNSVVSIFPGTGAVVGYDNLVPSQSGNRYAVSLSLRSTISPTVTNQLSFGFNRGITIFRGEVSSPSLFKQWKGYYPSLGFSLTNVAAVSGSSRRSAPVRELHDAVSMQKGSHTLSFGADTSQYNLWYQTVGTSVIPQVAFGAATGDPVVTGGTNLFTSLPSSYQSDAAALYALLTGRVSSFSRSVAFDGQSYKSVPPTERDRQYEWGVFAQDSWKISPSLTLTGGIRFQQQRPFQNVDGVYSSVSYASIWGISGIGNWYKPGVLGGVTPTFDKYRGDYYKIPNFWSPSAGLAWQLPASQGPLGFLFGKERGKSVLRAGYGISTIRSGSYTFQSLFGSNTGLTYSTSISASSYPTDFGAAGSVLFRQDNFPTRSGVPDAPQYPIPVTFTSSLNGYDPNLKMAYVQSWNIGFQRELSKSTVLEVRYTGNHGLNEWRQINVNEINTFENGFQSEFYQAQKNLFINRGCSGSWTNCSSTTNSFANAGLPGQGPVPIISTALGVTSDATTANNLRQNRPGTAAGSIYNNATYMNRLTAAGYPKNLFVVNPDVAGGGSYLLTNMGSSTYNALQVELNRHLANGLLAQASYVWSKSLMNGAGATGSSNDLMEYNQPTTFRNLGLDKVTPLSDIRHAFKVNWLYELPVGAGRRFLSGAPVLKKVLEGWELTGITRIQSGAPFQLTSGRSGMNGSETGVVLYNMTARQLQDTMQIRKVSGSDGIGQVKYLPDDFIANSNAAFELNGKTWANLDTSKPYVGPQLAPGQFGYRVYLRNPWQYHLDTALLKRTKIRERYTAEFQANFLNILNLTNFFLANAPSSTSFGRTTSYYNDFSGAADPGSRVIEFRLKFTF